MSSMEILLAKLVNRSNLAREEMAQAVTEVAEGRATPAQIAALLTALKMKGETAVEIAAAAEVMRGRLHRVNVSNPVFIDTCGTGGDGLNTFNISTGAALVVAAAGVVVAKHGNRAASSRCGSADVLAALGVNVDAARAVIERCIEQVGIGFLFVPHYHPAFKSAHPVRRELGFRTVFNLLGPLLNPAGARRQVMGVNELRWVRLVGEVQALLGAEHAWVVHGQGLDELTVTGETTVCEVKGNSLREFQVVPEEAGLRRWPLEALRGGDAEENARILREVFSGRAGAHRDAVLLNAAAGLIVGERATNLCEGVELASRAVDTGAAMRTLQQLAQATQEAR